MDKRTYGLHETTQRMKILDTLQILCQFECFNHFCDIFLARSLAEHCEEYNYVMTDLTQDILAYSLPDHLPTH